NRKVRRERWWQFAERAPELYRTLTRTERVLCFALTSRTMTPAFVSSRIVLDQTLIVITSDQPAWLSCFASSLNYAWVLMNGATLRTDLRYSYLFSGSDTGKTVVFSLRAAVVGSVPNGDITTR